MIKILVNGISVLLLLMIAGCGGGGGGGGDSEDLAARVFISVTPGALDTGDRASVDVQIEDLNQDGAAIKIKFPVGLKYIVGTTQLEVDGDFDDFAPTNNVSDDDSTYLVYYLRRSLLDDSGSGIIHLKLLGVAAVDDGQVEVDADLDDPSVSNQDEFSIETPNFAAQDGDGVTVNAE